MPKRKRVIKILNIKSKATLELKHEHALNLLRLQDEKGLKDFQLEEKGYIFKDNEIIYRKSNKDTTEAEE